MQANGSSSFNFLKFIHERGEAEKTPIIFKGEILLWRIYYYVYDVDVSQSAMYFKEMSSVCYKSYVVDITTPTLV